MHSQLRLLVKLLHVVSTLTILIASLRMAKITMTPSNPPKKQYRTYWYLMVLVKKSYILIDDYFLFLISSTLGRSSTKALSSDIKQNRPD